MPQLEVAQNKSSEGGQQKNIDEFYRMLDKERSGWYDQQIEDQKSNESSQSKEDSQAAVKKQFDMFD